MDEGGVVNNIWITEAQAHRLLDEVGVQVTEVLKIYASYELLQTLVICATALIVAYMLRRR